MSRSDLVKDDIAAHKATKAAKADASSTQEKLKASKTRTAADSKANKFDTARVGLAITRHLRLDVVGRVPLGCLDRRHFPVLAVLGATDSLLHHLGSPLSDFPH